MYICLFSLLPFGLFDLAASGQCRRMTVGPLHWIQNRREKETYCTMDRRPTSTAEGIVSPAANIPPAAVFLGS